MQNKISHVGANCVRQNFEEINPKKQNGITLIALIITIIIMLILVGVTVTTAMNGGLFQIAKQATTETQIAADKETLQAGIIGALNDQSEILKADALTKNLPQGWEVTGTDGGPYTCKSPKESQFIVDKDGTMSKVTE